jgi:orotate phosphoribosyltransferase
MGEEGVPATAAGILDLVAARRGHFRMESGYHSALWLDLDPLFVNARQIAPFVARLVALIRPHGAEAVCGPMVGGAFLAQLVARELGAEFWFTERVAPGAAAGRGLFQVRYRLPRAIAARAAGKRVAIVDDVMSAGSALRGTSADLEAHGAAVVAAGALLVLGSTGAGYFAERGVPVEAAASEPYALWLPGQCPLCAEGVKLEQVASGAGA